MTTRLSSSDRLTLYNRDYYLWLQDTAKLLEEGRLSEIDTVNLLEEIEDMGKSEQRAIESNLVVVLLHLLKQDLPLRPSATRASLLKYKYQPDKKSNSWKSSIREHRRRIRRAFKTSPSLKNYLRSVFNECYEDSREQAADETGLALDTFPVECPFTISEVLDRHYLPE